MDRSRAVILTVLLILLASQTLAEGQPLPKLGSYPSGYRQSGGYCAPMTPQAPVAVPKVGGQCPSGYAQSGAYCVEMKRGR